MRPLALAERFPGTATVSVAALLEGDRRGVHGRSPLRAVDYAKEVVASGFPAIRATTGRVRRALLAWLRAYAAATATSASYQSLLDAATPGERDRPARSTVVEQRAVLERLWVVDPQPAWLPTRNTLSRLGQAPKHHLADPALAARLLGLGGDALLGPAGGLFGPLFEALVTMSLRTYAQAAEARVLHLRTQNGDHEVDVILERGDGRVLAVEVTLAPTVRDHDVTHLAWLRGRLGDDLLDAVVVTTGEEAYRRSDGVAVVPAALLGP